MQLDPPGGVLGITRRLEGAGHPTWAVGGAVRDALLGDARGDWDLATAARPQQVRALFRRTVALGIEHGTVGVFGEDGVLYEVTTFRRDVETFGRHAVIEFADDVEEDLGRRDFTFNAIAWHPLRHELLDPFGGRRDLDERLLRTVGDASLRFAEDYLRVLRALRFAGQLRMRIEAGTWAELAAATPHLAELSAERVREELGKVLRKQRRASASLSLYAAAGVLPVLYPELEALVGLEPPGGGATDVWSRCLRAVDALPPHRTSLRLAALLHAVGMPAARVKDLRGGWRYTGHEVHGAAVAEALMRRLRASNAETEQVAALVRLQEELFPPDSPPAVVRRWLRTVGTARLNDLFRLRFALSRATVAGGAGGAADLLERWQKARQALAARPPLEPRDLAIGGAELRELGLQPGPRYGEILEALVERVLEEPELNTREALLRIVRTELIQP